MFHHASSGIRRIVTYTTERESFHFFCQWNRGNISVSPLHTLILESSEHFAVNWNDFVRFWKQIALLRWSWNMSHLRIVDTLSITLWQNYPASSVLFMDSLFIKQFISPRKSLYVSFGMDWIADLSSWYLISLLKYPCKFLICFSVPFCFGTFEYLKLNVKRL